MKFVNSSKFEMTIRRKCGNFVNSLLAFKGVDKL